jgi:hypothetical protein
MLSLRLPMIGAVHANDFAHFVQAGTHALANAIAQGLARRH